MKMGRRLSRGRGIGYVSIRYAPSSRLAAAGLRRSLSQGVTRYRTGPRQSVAAAGLENVH